MPFGANYAFILGCIRSRIVENFCPKHKKNVCLWINDLFFSTKDGFAGNFSGNLSDFTNSFPHINKKKPRNTTSVGGGYPPKNALFAPIEAGKAGKTVLTSLYTQKVIHRIFPKQVDNPLFSTFSVDKGGFCGYA